MKIAVIGAGFGVQAHLPVLAEIPEVEALFAADSGSGRGKVKLPENVRYLPSWREALKHADAVTVAVPPAEQKDIVLEVLRHGKHVFCEKPFGLNLREAQVMQDEAKENGCKAAVNFQFRFEPGIQIMKQHLEQEITGDIHAIDFSWLTSGRAKKDLPWSWRNDEQAGGGVIGAFFSHVADLIWWLTGQEINRIYGSSSIMFKHRPDAQGEAQEVTSEDFLVTQMNLSNGVPFSCRITNCQTGGTGMKIEVIGRKGILTYRHKFPFTLNEQSLTFSGNERREIVIPKPESPADKTETDTRLMAIGRISSGFVRNIQGSDEDLPGFGDAIRVHRVMSALKNSIATGHAVSI